MSGCTATTKRLMAVRPDRLGVLLTPNNGNAEWWDKTVTWACDNGCFRGLEPPAFLGMVRRVLLFRSRPVWVSCPDVVGDATETLRRFRVWGPMLREVGLRVALVAQDGLTAASVPWADTDAVFVGGSTGWKLGPDAARITLDAHARGLPVHWGRINTRRRIRYLGNGIQGGVLWADTIDGTGFSAYGDKRIPCFFRWADGALRGGHQPDLFTENQ